jgi:hypothetical protein
MRDLLVFMLKSFDYVLLDSPPLLVATDATVLSKVADGVILVASHDTARRHTLAAAVNDLAMVGGRLLGTVMTKVPPKKIGGYRTGRNYGYGYGYGYGYRPVGTDAQGAAHGQDGRRHVRHAGQTRERSVAEPPSAGHSRSVQVLSLEYPGDNKVAPGAREGLA